MAENPKDISSGIFRKIAAKVSRAEELVRQFELELGTYYDTRPYSIDVQSNVEAREHVYLLDRVEDIPDSLALIAGDAIQNLRSALDHLVNQLYIIRSGAERPPKSLYFPISASRADYESLNSRIILLGVHRELVDAIDAAEPYKDGKGHALWQLNELSKIDKHHLLISASSQYDGVWLTLAPFFTEEMKNPSVAAIKLRPSHPPPKLKSGDILLIDKASPDYDSFLKFDFHVAFDAPSVVQAEAALTTLQKLHNSVQEMTACVQSFY